jgi:hypothetical protein
MKSLYQTVVDGLKSTAPVLASLCLAAACSSASAQHAPFIPGSGIKIEEVGDDFEADDWSYTLNLPKASSNIDQEVRYPAGTSGNGRIFESTYRGTPDEVKRIKTPDGGLPGSKASLLMRALETGVPGRPSFQQQQDDLMLNVSHRLGRALSVSQGPSFVVRVYCPPWEYWEKRTGSSLGIRADCVTHVPEKSVSHGFFRTRYGGGMRLENYWPGFFIQYHHPKDPKTEKPMAAIVVRGDKLGHEIMGPRITEPGWWTFGMSFTGDGAVHYYARPGVGNLRASDHITSQFPYGYRCEEVNTFFFNVSNGDNGRTWSTPWVVDDPMVYVRHR